ncbi:MAG: hypothetical protein ACW98K_03785 [Candidatus Kariarchaeaceae archaeon]|jgi:hypothetical protein
MTAISSPQPAVKEGMEHLALPFEPHQPIMLLVAGDGGINLFAQSLDGRESIDPQLLTGGLKAFLSFFKEALGVPDQLSSIKLDDFCILPFEIDSLVVYYIFSGNEEGAHEKIAEFLNTLKNKAAWKRMVEQENCVSKRDLKTIQKMVETVFDI